MEKSALIVVDEQRGFMPAAEGERLHLPGFGELPVPDGELVVHNTNRLIGYYELYGFSTFTTQDWHQEDTQHFSDNPNYSTTWPVHCIGGTPGAELHPGIILGNSTERFRKGMASLLFGENDDSYTAIHAVNSRGEQLKDILIERNIGHVCVIGIAEDVCVKETAVDARRELGVAVTVVTDACAAISSEGHKSTLELFEDLGITTTTTDEWLELMAAA